MCPLSPTLLLPRPAGAPPFADFSAAPVRGAPPLVVTFTDESTGSPTSWSWDFGDGGTATVENPTHEYAAAGVYDVTLSVANAAGSDSITKSALISISPLYDGLVSAWNFAGDGADALGNNSLEQVNSPTFQAGLIGQEVALLRASNRYLRAADNGSQAFDTTFSLSLWFHLASTNFLSRQALISKWDASLSDGAWYCYLADLGALQVHVVLGTESGPLDVLSGIATRGDWTHLVAVFDGTQPADDGKLVVYLNGDAQDLSFDSSVPAELQASMADLQFGNLFNAVSGVNAFDGELDAAALWNRALTVDEVALLFNSGAGLEYPF